jgi:hypothetical protein
VITASAGAARRMLTFARAQRWPYLPAHASLAPRADGESVLSFGFAASAPLGLLPDH